jgi:hypothetical protein
VEKALSLSLLSLFHFPLSSDSDFPFYNFYLDKKIDIFLAVKACTAVESDFQKTVGSASLEMARAGMA